MTPNIWSHIIFWRLTLNGWLYHTADVSGPSVQGSKRYGWVCAEVVLVDLLSLDSCCLREEEEEEAPVYCLFCHVGNCVIYHEILPGRSLTGTFCIRWALHTACERSAKVCMFKQDPTADICNLESLQVSASCSVLIVVRFKPLPSAFVVQSLTEQASCWRILYFV